MKAPNVADAKISHDKTCPTTELSTNNTTMAKTRTKAGTCNLKASLITAVLQHVYILMENPH